MFKHEKIKKEFEKMSEREFQKIYYGSKCYEKLLDKTWIIGLKINDKVAACEHFDCWVFRYATITKISRKYITVVNKFNCESRYDRKSGKEVVKHPYNEGNFLCRPQDWMERIEKEHRERIKSEMNEEYEKHKDNKAWLEHAHYI